MRTPRRPPAREPVGERGPAATPVRAVGVAYSLVVVLSASACGPDRAPGYEPPTIRDSAGVTVVENTAPRLPPGSWTVGTPSVACSASGAAGDPRVNAVGSIVPMGGDTVAGLSYQAQRVLICAAGRVVRVLGGEGGGPGEFSDVRALVPAAGDSVAVAEVNRVTFLDPATGGVRTLALHEVDGEGTGFLAGRGGLVVVRPAREVASSSGARYDLLRIDAEGNVVAAIPGTVWSNTAASSMIDMALWNPGRTWVLGDERYWWSPRDRLQLHLHDPDGFRRVVRAPWTPPEITDDMWDRGAASIREEMGGQVPPEVLEQIVGTREDAPTGPAVLSLKLGDEGELWVQLAQHDPVGEANRWRVFGADGVWLTDVAVPRDVQIERVENDRIFGVRNDELGLQTVVIHPLTR